MDTTSVTINPTKSEPEKTLVIHMPGLHGVSSTYFRDQYYRGYGILEPSSSKQKFVLTPSLCRDRFLYEVFSNTVLGRKETRCCLVISKSEVKRVDYANAFNGKLYRLLLSTDGTTERDTGLYLLVFSVTPEIYRNPCYFWFYTDLMRKEVTGYTKTGTEWYRRTPSYTDLCNFAGLSGVPQSSLHSAASARFFTFHSPATLLQELDRQVLLPLGEPGSLDLAVRKIIRTLYPKHTFSTVWGNVILENFFTTQEARK